jgi:phosphopantothenoylcysteine synthetase/decarboxylase
VADYTLDRQAEKIKSGQDLTLHLTPTPKIIKKVRERRRRASAMRS